MPFISPADRDRIEAAIAAAERRTTAEFVTVIALESDDYAHIPLLTATGAVFALSGLALFLPVHFSQVMFWCGQVLGFVGLALLLNWSPLKMRLVPQNLKRRRAHLLAHEQFLDLGLGSTRNRTGVMLFVSVAEHYVEIITDRGISIHVSDDTWQGIIAQFAEQVRKGRVADGFIDAIKATADLLSGVLPWQEDDSNELPNRLVVL